MPLQLNIWLLLLGALQGLLLSLVLLRKRVYREGYGFLLLYLLVLLVQVLFKVVDKAWLMDNVRTTYSLSYKLPLLYGPLVFLFVRQLTGGAKKFVPKDLLHFLPFAYTLVVLNLRWVPGFPTLFLWPLKAMPTLVLTLLSLGIYHRLAYRLWMQHTEKLKDNFSELQSFQVAWVRRFIQFSFDITVGIAVFIFMLYELYPQYTALRFGFVLLCCFVYWISYSALQQPALFTRFQLQTPHEKPLPLLPVFVVHRPQKKYAHSTLAAAEAERIAAALATCMTEKRLYANPSLSIDDLAEAVRTNRYLLSQVLNEKLGQNFYEYVNGFRIAAAQQLLRSEMHKDYKIAAIGYEAGFNSLSAFNDVFKKRTGCTPSQYRKEASDNLEQKRV